MLLVSNFNSIQKKYNNQGLSTNYCIQPKFQSKADSVSFTSNKTNLTRVLDRQTGQFVEEIIQKYGDVLGANFQAKFLEPLNQFLSQHGISIHHNNIPSWVTEVYPTARQYGEVKNASTASLIDSSEIVMHDLDFTRKDGAAVSFTKNGATARLIQKLVSGDLRILNMTTPSFKNAIPEDLAAVTTRVNEALDQFTQRCFDAGCDNANLKAGRIQAAFEKIMPQK